MSSRGGRSNFWRGHRQRGHNNSSRNSQCGPSSCTRTGQILSAQNGCVSQVQHRRPRQVQTSLISCPFKKWSLYFPGCGELTHVPHVACRKVKTDLIFFTTSQMDSVPSAVVIIANGKEKSSYVNATSRLLFTTAALAG